MCHMITSDMAFLKPVWRCVSVARRQWSSRIALALARTFYDVELLLSGRMKKASIKRKNSYFGYTQKQYGHNVAAAYYLLSLKGGFRFEGQTEWFRPNPAGRFSWDFINHRDSLIEEVDASGTVINYRGLDNMLTQTKLRSLSLRGCPEVDDWFLSRLHVFNDSLEELDVSHCPCVTVGGLCSLHKLRKLRYLHVSSLSRLQNPGLVRLLLEEVLPQCQVTGVEYEDGLVQGEKTVDTIHSS